MVDECDLLKLNRLGWDRVEPRKHSSVGSKSSFRLVSIDKHVGGGLILQVAYLMEVRGCS